MQTSVTKQEYISCRRRIAEPTSLNFSSRAADFLKALLSSVIPLVFPGSSVQTPNSSMYPISHPLDSKMMFHDNFILNQPTFTTSFHSSGCQIALSLSHLIKEYQQQKEKTKYYTVREMKTEGKSKCSYI